MSSSWQRALAGSLVAAALCGSGAIAAGGATPSMTRGASRSAVMKLVARYLPTIHWQSGMLQGRATESGVFQGPHDELIVCAIGGRAAAPSTISIEMNTAGSAEEVSRTEGLVTEVAELAAGNSARRWASSYFHVAGSRAASSVQRLFSTSSMTINFTSDQSGQTVGLLVARTVT